MKEARAGVLIIESNPDRVQLLEEAFGEMEELRFYKPAFPVCEREYALDWREAAELLRGRPDIDAILLNISLDTSAALTAFLTLRAVAPAAAMLLMAAPADEQMALGLVRQGAQDYLLEPEIDCLPLARALRCGIERSRLHHARESMSLLDDQTGLFNGQGMTVLMRRDERLAAGLGLEQWAVEVRLEPGSSADGHDLRRLELADHLNELTANGPAAGRTGEDTFIVAGLAATTAEAQTTAHGVAEHVQAVASSRGFAVTTEARAYFSVGRPAACHARQPPSSEMTLR